MSPQPQFYEITFRRSALKELKKLDRPIRTHLIIQQVQYRIIYQIFKEEITINVVMVGTRENIYNSLKKRIY